MDDQPADALSRHRRKVDRMRERMRARLEARLRVRGSRSMGEFEQATAREEQALALELAETEEHGDPVANRIREIAILERAGVRPVPEDYERWVVRTVGLTNRVLNKSALRINREYLQLRSNPANFAMHDHDSTGFRIWESTIALCRLLLEHEKNAGTSASSDEKARANAIAPPRFTIKGKCICEIGCGMAVPSIVAAKMGAARVVATDRDTMALEAVSVNRVMLNISDVMTAPSELAFGNAAHIAGVIEERNFGAPFDMVFAVDLFYTKDKGYLQSVAQTIIALISVRRSKGEEKELHTKGRGGGRDDIVALIGYWERLCCPLADFMVVLDKLSDHGLYSRRIRADFEPCNHPRLHIYEVMRPAGAVLPLLMLMLLVLSAVPSTSATATSPPASSWSPFYDDTADATGLLDVACGVRRVVATQGHAPEPELFEKPFVTARRTWAADRRLRSGATSWSNRSHFLNRFGNESVHHDLVSVFSFQGYTWKRTNLREYVEQFMPEETSAMQIERLTATQNRMRDDKMYDVEPGEFNASYAFTSFRADEGEFATVMRDTTYGARSGGNDEGLPAFLSAHMSSAASKHDRVPVDQIAMGGTGSGLNWHSHGDAWNTIVVGGHKLWLLAAPGSQDLGHLRSHMALTGLQWWRRAHVELETHEYGDDGDDDETTTTPIPAAPDGVLSCVLGPGEVMFVPKGWLHATINLGHVVARSQRLGIAGRKDAT
eukprot:g4603.t1